MTKWCRAFSSPCCAVLCCAMLRTNEIGLIASALLGINLCPSLLCMSANVLQFTSPATLIQYASLFSLQMKCNYVLVTYSMSPEFASINAFINRAFVIVIKSSIRKVLCTSIGVIATLSHHGRSAWNRRIYRLSWATSHRLLLTSSRGHVSWSISELCRGEPLSSA